eukprot:6459046-Alexandrium_andersonii.AAC.1
MCIRDRGSPGLPEVSFGRRTSPELGVARNPLGRSKAFTPDTQSHAHSRSVERARRCAVQTLCT